MSLTIEHFGQELLKYCEKFAVPVDYIFEILNDQKVVPMIRGKATEFRGYLELTNVLPNSEWSVEKLNLNAQPGSTDEDISVTHKRTGIILKAECKNAVRGSMRSGLTARKCRVPHFRVKCHRSRSNIKLAGSTNDRYSVDTFDLIISNVSNSLFQGGTLGAQLELLYDKEVLDIVTKYYQVSVSEDLIKAAYEDWRFVFPKAIAEHGFIPRTPLVQLQDDPNWKSLQLLPEMLLEVVKSKLKKGKKRGRKT